MAAAITAVTGTAAGAAAASVVAGWLAKWLGPVEANAVVRLDEVRPLHLSPREPPAMAP